MPTPLPPKCFLDSTRGNIWVGQYQKNQKSLALITLGASFFVCLSLSFFRSDRNSKKYGILGVQNVILGFGGNCKVFRPLSCCLNVLCVKYCRKSVASCEVVLKQAA